MPEETAGERTEDATPKRRRDARKKGTVARTPDLSASVSFLAFVLLFPAIGLPLVLALMTYTRTAFGSAGTGTLSINDLLTHLVRELIPVGWAMLPLLFVGVVIGLVINFLQVGFAPSIEVLQPQLSRIDPLQGSKRLLSSRAVVEAVKASLKTFLIGYIAFVTIRDRADVIQGIGTLETVAAISVVGGLITSIMVRVGVVWFVIAIMDYIFQKHQVEKQLKMSKEEVKREMKESEQGPEIRMALARRRAQLARQRMMSAVKTADAIVTNPTHFAIALKYDNDKMSAPQVVAKGQDLMAQRIRQEAEIWRVPIVQNPPLAKSLYKLCEVGDMVPEKLYAAVAEVIAFVLARRRRRRAR
jgi:flagellar biosynthetic protein FlhB